MATKHINLIRRGGGKKLTGITLKKEGLTNLEKDLPQLFELTQLTSINFVSNRIQDFSSLGKLPNLVRLDLRLNKIDRLDSLKDLTNLKSIILSSNKIKDISPLKELTNLVHLDLRNNSIEDVTPLSSLTNLRRLSITTSSINDLGFLENLPYLTKLDLRINKISDLSPLANLYNLRTLNLSNNNITDISPLSNLPKLQRLTLRQNKISNLEPLRSLESIRFLDLRDNEVKDLTPILPIIERFIPLEFDKRKRRRKLFQIDNNPLETPPVEILNEGFKAVINYVNQLNQEKGERNYLFETKLLIIGEAGAGKTTFARRLKDPNAPMPKPEETTHGISVDKWSFTITPDELKFIDSPHPFHVNLWDFGGQEIYHATHQFFFGKKSLYVLLADTREQKTDFSYWLNTVEKLCGENSILFILLNKRGGHEWSIDELGYRSRYGTIIKEIKTIDLSISAEIPALRERISFWFKNLEGIGQPLIKSWVQIREALSTEEADTISYDRFKEICSEFGQNDEEDIYFISKYFHRIGVFTHYIEDPALLSTIYLNSNKLVKKVYKLLDDTLIKKQQGRITQKELEQTWGLIESKKILALLNKFGLMYKASDNHFIVPEHLSKARPYETWEHEKGQSLLQYRYQFDKYMPKGIMSRLIVVLHDYILDHNLVWHRGVNLSHNRTYAEIIEQYGGTNQFDIRITGLFPRDLLIIITQAFDKILSDFQKLEVSKSVRCPCEECEDSTEPYFHNIADIEQALIKKYKKRNPTVECKVSYEQILIKELLLLIDAETVWEEIKEKLKDSAVFEELEEIQSELRSQGKYISAKLDNIEILFMEEFSNLSNELESLSNREEIAEIIKTSIDTGNEQLFEEITSFLTVAFEVNNLIQSENLGEYKDALDSLKKSSDYWESKIKFAVPLLNLIGLQIETKFDLKKFIKNIKKKTEELAIKYNIYY